MTKTKTTNPTLEQQNLYLKTLCRVYEKMIYRLYKGSNCQQVSFTT